MKKEEDDSDSDAKNGSSKKVDPIADEFRIFKTKELRLDEIMEEAKRQNMSDLLFQYDPDNDGLTFSFDIALKIHKRVNMFQMVR